MTKQNAKTRTVKRLVFGLLVLLWMAVIFVFSTRTAPESSAVSGRFTGWLSRLFFPEWYLPENAADLSNHLMKLEYLVRKSAHFAEFLVLGGFLSLFLNEIDLKPVLRLLTGIAAGVLYACSDEFHQSFVAGRAMQGFDLVIDTGGVIFGVLLISGISAMCMLRRLERNSGECSGKETETVQDG